MRQLTQIELRVLELLQMAIPRIVESTERIAVSLEEIADKLPDKEDNSEEA